MPRYRLQVRDYLLATSLAPRRGRSAEIQAVVAKGALVPVAATGRRVVDEAMRGEVALRLHEVVARGRQRVDVFVNDSRRTTQGRSRINPYGVGDGCPSSAIPSR